MKCTTSKSGAGRSSPFIRRKLLSFVIRILSHLKYENIDKYLLLQAIFFFECSIKRFRYPFCYLLFQFS